MRSLSRTRHAVRPANDNAALLIEYVLLLGAILPLMSIPFFVMRGIGAFFQGMMRIVSSPFP